MNTYKLYKLHFDHCDHCHFICIISTISCYNKVNFVEEEDRVSQQDSKHSIVVVTVTSFFVNMKVYKDLWMEISHLIDKPSMY